MGEAFIPYTEREEDALEELGDHSAETLYRRLRRSMDWRTRTVGRIAPISHGGLMLRMKQFTTRGKGVQEHPYTKDVLRSDIRKLIKAGLLVRVGNDEALCFLCPFARDDSARVRQTPHIPTTPLSTEHTTGKASSGAGFEGYPPSLKIEQDAPNPPYIKIVDKYTPQSSSTDLTGVAPGDADAGGVNRDRPAASQAGSLGRPGNTQGDPDRDRPTGSHVGPQGADFDENSHRDRPTASHPAPGRRLMGAAQPLGALLPAGTSEAHAGSAANESTPGAGASPEANDLLGVLQRRGINARGAWVELEQWAADGVTPDVLAEVVERAVAARIKVDSTQPITLAYVGTILRNDRKQAFRTAKRIGGGLPSGTSGLDAMARQLGIALARPGETNDQYRNRVSLAWASREQGVDGQGGHHGAA